MSPTGARLFHAGPLYQLLEGERDGAPVLITRLLAPAAAPAPPASPGAAPALPPSPTPPPSPAMDVATRIAEARARATHPAIPPVLEVRVGPGGTAEWVEPMPVGPSLAELTAAGPLPAPLAAAVIHALAGAIEALHGAGLRLLALPPERIVVAPDGRLLLVGVGVAEAGRALAPGLRFPDARWEQLAPVAALTPPELLRNDALTDSADVFVLAGLAFLCLTGRLPYSGTALEVWRASQRGAPLDAAELRPELGTAVADALRRSLRPHAHERHASPAELAAAVTGTDAQPPLAAALDPLRARLHATPWASRHATLTTLDAPGADDPARRLRTAQAVLDQLHVAVRERKASQRSRRTEILLLAGLLALLLLPFLLFR